VVLRREVSDGRWRRHAINQITRISPNTQHMHWAPNDLWHTFRTSRYAAHPSIDGKSSLDNWDVNKSLACAQNQFQKLHISYNVYRSREAYMSN